MSMPGTIARTTIKPKLTLPLIAFILSFLTALTIVFALEDSYRQIRTGKAHEAADQLAHALERSLSHSLNAAYGLGAAVRHHQGRLDDFQELAKYIVPHDEHLYALALAPNGTIDSVAPASRPLLVGNGDLASLFNGYRYDLELLKLPQDKVTFKGPIRLGNGSLGAIGILPIYIGKHPEDKTFWGLTVVAISLTNSFLDFDLKAVKQRGYHHEISGTNPITGKLEVLPSSDIAPDEQQRSIEREIMGTSLTLRLARINQLGYRKLFLAICLALLICSFIAWSAYMGIELALQRKELKDIALYDALTGLPNRRLLMERLELATDDANRTRRKVAISYLDLDGLKKINDTFGHATGDKVLVEVSSRIQHCLRNSDTFARVGGDEFVLILGNLNHEHEADVILNRILNEAKIDFCFEGQKASISVSVGTAFYDTHGMHTHQLLAQADDAMYQAKKRGKNRIVIAPIRHADNC
ncbi:MULTISPECIES: sensor domain-containing diguanylate cyclase [Pseudomonas]|jgi:diguanylate cyclase (GGDEF)-like protein|uniref:sensor domain-containing diguanylate cyclase n=2 Tax=Pseudomonas TaxID=286 RepID=UPI0021F89200|nr:sensor domain-containing diguanylate cyclase [Pseudomonas putida]